MTLLLDEGDSILVTAATCYRFNLKSTTQLSVEILKGYKMTWQIRKGNRRKGTKEDFFTYLKGEERLRVQESRATFYCTL